MRHPIYDAEPIEKLRDLERAVKMAIEYFQGKFNLVPTGKSEVPELRDDEFAIGNWIARPRFKEAEPNFGISIVPGKFWHCSGTDKDGREWTWSHKLQKWVDITDDCGS